MSILELPLPESLKRFVESQAAARGYASSSDYVVALLRALERRQAWEGLEPLVLEGLATPAREVTPQDWQSYREEIDRLEARQQP
jgi:antitoxin ParD1/3/4